MNKTDTNPSDIDISNHLVGSPLAKSELETVACTIIILSRRNDNEWLSFTWEEYQQLCDHKVTSIHGRVSEEEILDELTQDGLLNCNDGVYSVQDAFICTLRDFI